MDTLVLKMASAVKKQNNTVTIPKQEYLSLLRLKTRVCKEEYVLTPTQKKALLRAEENLSNRTTLSFHELTKKLGY